MHLVIATSPIKILQYFTSEVYAKYKKYIRNISNIRYEYIQLLEIRGLLLLTLIFLELCQYLCELSILFLMHKKCTIYFFYSKEVLAMFFCNYFYNSNKISLYSI